MMGKARSYERRQQVLQVLANYGPLTAPVLMSFLPQPSSERALRRVLQRLYMRRALARRLDRVSGAVYHQIGQKTPSLERAAKILGVAAASLKQPQFRRVYLLHHEDCAIWTEALRRSFPEARVQRRFQFAGGLEAQCLWLSRTEERDLLPDILLSQEAKPHGEISVGVVIDSIHYRKEAWFLRRLRGYAEHTHLDGLIYVVPSDFLQKRMLDVFSSKPLQRALVRKHSGKQFLLFSTPTAACGRAEPHMLNLSLEAVSLRDWMHTLLASKNGIPAPSLS